MRIRSLMLLTGLILLLSSCLTTEEKAANAFEDRYDVKLAWFEKSRTEIGPPFHYRLVAGLDPIPNHRVAIVYDEEADTLVDDSYLILSYKEQFREEFGIQHSDFPYLDLVFVKIRDESEEGDLPWKPYGVFEDDFYYASSLDFEKDLAVYRQNHDDFAVALRFYMRMSDVTEERLQIVKVLLDRLDKKGQAWTKMDVVFFEEKVLGIVSRRNLELGQVQDLRRPNGKKEIHILPHPDLPNPTPAEMLKYIDTGKETDCIFAESHDIYSAALGYGDEPVEDPIKMLEDLVAQYDPRFEGGRWWDWGYTLRAATDLVEYYLENENRVKARNYLDLLEENGEALDWWSFDEYQEIKAKLNDQ